MWGRRKARGKKAEVTVQGSSPPQGPNAADGSSGVDNVPDEILMMILQHLDLQELGRVCCVSRRLNSVAGCQELWLPFLQESEANSLLSLYGTRFKDKSAKEMVLASCLGRLQWVAQQGKEGGRARKGKRKIPKKKKPIGSPMDEIPSNSEFKVALLGSGGVGTKSALVIRFVKGHFVEEYDPTIEDSFRHKSVVDNKEVLVEFLDTAGQEEFAAMRDQWIRSSEGFLLGYSLQNRNSFTEVERFHEQIVQVKQKKAAQIPIVLVGGKVDLIADRVVSTEEGLALAARLGVPFFEVSAAANFNITECVSQLVRECAARRLGKSFPPPHNPIVCLVSRNGSTYAGECDRATMQPDGQGLCIFAAADNALFRSYLGGWKHGKPDGHGTVVPAVSSTGTSDCYAGVWKEGMLVAALCGKPRRC